MPSNILTYSGRWFDPLNPDPELIDIRDIAHALSNICRFTGHVSRFYSVAEHSCHVSDMLPLRDALWGLLHDASEAYLGDVARPLKTAPYFGGPYRDAELMLMTVIAERFELIGVCPESVHKADNEMLMLERDELLPSSDEWPSEPGLPMTPALGWQPNIAYDEFLTRFASLVPGVPLPV